jgi:hypothetical protein
MTDEAAILDARYQRMLDDVIGARALLTKELAIEDEYQEAVFTIIRRAGADSELADYAGSEAFAGGAANMADLLEGIRQLVGDAARQAGFHLRPFICRLWPDPGLNARVVETENGAVIVINTGLLIFLRLAAQYTASSMATITCDPGKWGPDKNDRATVAGRFVDRLRKYRAGIDVRQQLIIEVIRGPREQFRRQLNHFGLAYIVAHEVGHMVAPVEGATPALSLTSILNSPSEEEEVATWHDEFMADLTAYQILGAPPLGSTDPPLVVAMGSMLVSGMQAALWWMDRAEGSQNFGWSHPAPDIRIACALLTLAPDSMRRRHVLAKRFRRWMQFVFGINQWMKDAKEHDV